ncbi:MAG: VWA domain-containing protein [Silvanigrellales bacterium]|jgi:hypothetical protein|nr:VWA domain-containing protein [Silvanigrellales bacterium]
MFRSKSSLVAFWSVVVVAGACTKTSFQGNKKTSNPAPVAEGTPIPKPGETSPGELDGLKKPRPSNPVVECAGKYRGVRMAIVIDTSHSMGAATCGAQASAQVQTQTQTQQGTLLLEGSDPAREGTSIRGKTECFTDRQNAAWRIITRTAERDREGENANKTFMGSAVGVAHFPAGLEGAASETYAKISGTDPLKGQMTSLTGVTFDDAFKGGVWTLLERTHGVTGITPYRAALAAGRDLLKTGRDPNDPRRDVLFVVTDGLPTDQRPSEVLKLRQEIADVDVIYLYMFDPTVDEASRQAKAKESLRAAFTDKSWGRVVGNTDGYAATEFERYWNDLVAIPGKIATTRIDVTKPSELVPKIDAVLSAVQACE